MGTVLVTGGSGFIGSFCILQLLSTGHTRDVSAYVKSKTLAEGAAAKKVPTWQLPNWIVRLAALRDSGVKQILPELGKKKNAKAIVATAESLVRLGLLKI